MGGSKAKLEQIKKMDDYPREFIPKNPDITKVASGKNPDTTEAFLLFFSPDFSHFMDIDRRKGQVSINDTYTDQLICLIPKDIFGFKSKNETKLALQRFRWIDNSTFKIVSESGFEKIVNYEQGCTQVAYNTIPEFDKDPDEWQKAPYYYCLPRVKVEAQLPHYQRKIRRYKSLYYLENKRDPSTINESLYTVEALQLQHSNLTFSFLDWKLIELICQNQVNIEDLTFNMVQRILNCILPGGNTLMHKLCKHQQTDDVQTLFRISQPDKSNLDDIKFQIPILPNFQEETPLHIAVRNNDFKTIDAMLGYLKGYPVDHHSRAISDLVPLIIEKDLAEMIPYLKSREQETAQSREFNKGCLREGPEKIIASPLWFRQNKFEEEVLDTTAVTMNPISCKFIDIPAVYHYQDENFQTLFESLAGTENFELFQVNSIQKIIEFNYPLVQKYTIYYLLLPYVVFLASYFVYYNMVYYQIILPAVWDPTDDKKLSLSVFILQWVLLAVQAIMAVYFLTNELKQFVMEPINYLMSVWNYIDIIPPVGILYLIFSYVFKLNTLDVLVAVQAVTALFMWFKFLYFLRIFKETGYLIRMIILVIYDMKVFLFVLLIGLCAFADAFLSFSLSNTEDEQFVGSFINSLFFTYRMILGDFDVEGFGSVASTVALIFFLLCTVLNMIVMLNLLISIISESFAQINSNAQNAAYQEMAALISENCYLIPTSVQKSYAKEGLQLMVITDLVNSTPEVFDQYMDQFCQLRSDQQTAVKEIKDTIKRASRAQELRDEKVENLQQQILKVQQTLDKLMELSQPHREEKMDTQGDGSQILDTSQEMRQLEPASPGGAEEGSSLK